MVNCEMSPITIIMGVGIICSTFIIVEAADSLVLGHVRCEDPFPGYELMRGVWMLILSIMGLVSSKWPNKALQGAYLTFLMIFLLVTLFLTGALAFGTTDSEARNKNSEKAYRLESYSSWLRKNLVNDEKMMVLGRCLAQKNVCKEHMYGKEKWEHPIEIGCCNPPSSCGYKRKNETWEMPEAGVNSDDLDCLKWDLQGNGYCYTCDSCKASVIAVFLRYWYFRDFVCFLYAILLLCCFAYTIHH